MSVCSLKETKRTAARDHDQQVMLKIQDLQTTLLPISLAAGDATSTGI